MQKKLYNYELLRDYTDRTCVHIAYLFSVNMSNTVSANQTFFGLRSPPVHDNHQQAQDTANICTLVCS